MDHVKHELSLCQFQTHAEKTTTGSDAGVKFATVSLKRRPLCWPLTGRQASVQATSPAGQMLRLKRSAETVSWNGTLHRIQNLHVAVRHTPAGRHRQQRDGKPYKTPVSCSRLQARRQAAAYVMPPVSDAEVDHDLWRVLDLATDGELVQLHNILYGEWCRSLSCRTYTV